jgi:Replication protein C C-terminal region
MKGVELYARVRFAVQIEGLSRREAAGRFGIDPRTVDGGKDAEVFGAARVPAEPAEMGISRTLWARACQVMGRPYAAVALALVSTRDAGHFTSGPGGYFAGMLRKYEKGELRLAGTLWALPRRNGASGANPCTDARSAPFPTPKKAILSALMGKLPNPSAIKRLRTGVFAGFLMVSALSGGHAIERAG